MTHSLLKMWMLEPEEYSIRKTSLLAPMKRDDTGMKTADSIDVGSFIVCEDEAIWIVSRNECEYTTVRGAMNSSSTWHASGSVVWYAAPAEPTSSSQ